MRLTGFRGDDERRGGSAESEPAPGTPSASVKAPPACLLEVPLRGRRFEFLPRGARSEQRARDRGGVIGELTFPHRTAGGHLVRRRFVRLVSGPRSRENGSGSSNRIARRGFARRPSSRRASRTHARKQHQPWGECPNLVTPRARRSTPRRRRAVPGRASVIGRVFLLGLSGRNERDATRGCHRSGGGRRRRHATPQTPRDDSMRI